MQRLFRLVRMFKPFAALLNTFSHTMSTCFPILGVLLCLM
jgi:hypothetical protein